MIPTYKPGTLLEGGLVIARDRGLYIDVLLPEGDIFQVKKEFGPKSFRAHYLGADSDQHLVLCNDETMTLIDWIYSNTGYLFDANESPMKFYQRALKISNEETTFFEKTTLKRIPIDILYSLPGFYVEHELPLFQSYLPIMQMHSQLIATQDKVCRICSHYHYQPTFKEIVRDIRDDLEIEDIETYLPAPAFGRTL